MNKRHPGRPKTKFEWEPCKVEGCVRTTEKGAKGMCPTHYMQTVRGMRAADGTSLRAPRRASSYGPGSRCVIAGCTSRPKAQGLCNAHYIRASENGVLAQYKRSPYHGVTSHCLVPSCEKRPVNRGMCSTHAQQRIAGIINSEGVQLRAKKAWKRTRSETWVGRDGYVLVKAPEGHPRARADGSILEHRLVAEKALGRYLEEWEVVHHKNGDRSDNHPENLQVLDGRAKSGEGHAPGHENTVDDLQRRLEHLQHNDPAAFSSLVKKLVGAP